MLCRALTALPVYNEVRHVMAVLDEVRRFCPEILVVNDGSSDGTAELLAQRRDIHVVTHEKNQGMAWRFARHLPSHRPRTMTCW